MFDMFNTKAEQLSNSINSSDFNRTLSNQANREAYERKARENKRAMMAQAEATNAQAEAINNLSEVILKVFSNLNKNQMENLKKLLSLPETQLDELLECINNKKTR